MGKYVQIACLMCGALLAGCGDGAEAEPFGALPASATSNAPSVSPAASTTAAEPTVSEQTVATEESTLPAEWLPVPTLSQETIDANPLLSHMMGAADLDIDPEDAPFLALIGFSRYVLVDAAGVPVEFDGEAYHRRSIEITALHGSDQPVVYLLYPAAFQYHPDVNDQYSVDDRGEAGVLTLDGETGRYTFSTDEVPGIFENRWAFGDAEPSTIDGPLMSFLESEFTIWLDVE